MHPSGYQSSDLPPPPASSPTRPSKVLSQREYREKEGECFNILRDIIKDLTGTEPRTRYEILRKSAIDILYTASEIRKHKGAQAQAGTSLAQEMRSPTNHEGTTSHVADYSTQPHLFSQGWQSPYAEFDATNHYDTVHFHDQQFFPMSDMDSALNQTSHQARQGYDGEWPNYPQ